MHISYFQLIYGAILVLATMWLWFVGISFFWRTRPVAVNRFTWHLLNRWHRRQAESNSTMRRG